MPGKPSLRQLRLEPRKIITHSITNACTARFINRSSRVFIEKHENLLYTRGTTNRYMYIYCLEKINFLQEHGELARRETSTACSGLEDSERVSPARRLHLILPFRKNNLRRITGPFIFFSLLHNVSINPSVSINRALSVLVSRTTTTYSSAIL